MSNDPTSQPLANLLAAKSPLLAERYTAISSELRSGVQRYAVSIGELPDYGPRHSQDVEQIIDLLLSDAAKKEMLAEEIFLLLCAVQFHRIGLLSQQEPDEDVDTIIKDFPQRTYDYLEQHYQQWHLQRPEAQLTKQICLGLSAKGCGMLPEWQMLGRSKVRVRFLAALLRLGDLLDTDYTTVSSHLLKLRKLSPSSLQQWLRNSAIAGVDVDCKRWKIIVSVAPVTYEGRELLKEYIEGDLQHELDLVRPILDKNGLYFETIRMDLVFQEIQRDEELVDALKDYYQVDPSFTRTTPYKYLDYFEPQDHDYFFGRRFDIERYLGYIKNNGLVVLYGDSGIGKTSLIRAGLIPRLIYEGCIPVYGRCFDVPANVILDNTAAILEQVDARRSQPTTSTLGEFFEQRRRLGYRFVVFLDQFEEFFIRFPPEVQREFIDQIIGCLNHVPRLSLTIVLSLRREYLVELGHFKTRLKELYDNAFELRKMTEEEVHDAIVEPARQLSIEYEPDLIKQMVRDIYQEGNYNTPHIQIVCDKLVGSLEEPSARVITLALYERLGRARRILAEYLEAELNRFDPETQPSVKTILKEMVTSHGTKTVSTVAEIALRSQMEETRTEDLLLELTNHSRLLRRLEVQGQPVFELAHEFLVERVREWLEAGDMEVKAIYEMLDRQLIERERQGFFLDKQRLGEIEQYRERLALSDRHKALIIESYLSKEPTSYEKRFWVQSMQIEDAVPILVRSLSTADPIIYHESMREIATLGNPALVHLILYLRSTDWQIRQGVIEALVAIGAEVAPSVVQLLQSDDRRVRRSAVTVLVRLGEPIRAELEEALQSADERTASSIKECLSLIEFYKTQTC
jgi:hypothetical protein